MKSSFKSLMAIAVSLFGAASCLTGCEKEVEQPKVVKYSIQFEDYDGSVLQLTNFEEGAEPKYNGATPTRAEDENYTYVFDNWFPALETVSEDMIYTATYRAIEKEKPATSDVKSALKFMNETKNFTFSYSNNELSFDLLYEEDSIGYVYPDATNNNFVYYDGTGTFEIEYDDGQSKYLASVYRSEKNVYEADILPSFYGSCAKFIDTVPAGVTKYEINDKDFKIAFVRAVGFNAYAFLEISSLVAEIKDNALEFTMKYNGKDFVFTVKDFGTTVNEPLLVQIAKGIKAFTLSDDLQKMNAGIMGNNFAEEIYSLDTEDPTRCGFAGYNIFTDKYYISKYNALDGASYQGYIYLKSKETALHPEYDGTYMINFTTDSSGTMTSNFNVSQLPINSTNNYLEACFYPSTSLLFNNLHYLQKWHNVFFARTKVEGKTVYDYEPSGYSYSTDNKYILEDSINIFALNTFIEQGATLEAIGIDINLDAEGELDVVMVVAALMYAGTLYNYYMPFYAFGTAQNPYCEAFLKLL